MPIDSSMYWRLNNAMPRNPMSNALNAGTQAYDASRQRGFQDQQAEQNALLFKMKVAQAQQQQQEQNRAQGIDVAAGNALGNIGRLKSPGMDQRQMFNAEMQGRAPDMTGTERVGVAGQYNAINPEQKEAQGTMTDIWRYAGLAEQQWAAENPGVQMPADLKMKAMMDIKRAMPEEAGAVRTAQLQADRNLKPQIAGEVSAAQLASELETKPKIAGAEKAAKDRETRATDLINRGVMAAESTATIRRGLDLLKSVKTGGFDNAALAAKKFFGVEGADEGELSQAMGKAVLSQLRETFGAAFTQEEGNRLIRLEAGFGKSVANNTRLLEQSLKISNRAAKRARKEAMARGDKSTVEDIDDLLSFSLSDDTPLPQGVSEDDITATMKANKMTREQVMQRLGSQ